MRYLAAPLIVMIASLSVDFLGGQGNGLVLPLTVGKSFDRLDYQLARTVLIGLDLRGESDRELRALFDAAVDPYASLRSAYQQSRQGEIDTLHGGALLYAPAELSDDLTDAAETEATTSKTGAASLADPSKNRDVPPRP